MTTLEFEFIRRRRLAWVSGITFALMLTWCGSLGMRWHTLSQQQEQKEASIASLGRAIDAQRRKSAEAKRKADPLRAQRASEEGQVRLALGYPWNGVFKSLENADGEHLAVLSFAHDQSTGSSRLSVETMDVTTLTAFAERLNQGDPKARWYIASYHLHPQNTPATVIAEMLQGKVLVPAHESHAGG